MLVGVGEVTPMMPLAAVPTAKSLLSHIVFYHSRRVRNCCPVLFVGALLMSWERRRRRRLGRSIVQGGMLLELWNERGSEGYMGFPWPEPVRRHDACFGWSAPPARAMGCRWTSEAGIATDLVVDAQGDGARNSAWVVTR